MPTFAAQAASLSDLRVAVAELARAAGADPGQLPAMVLAANEAATNAIVHGYGGGDPAETVELEVESDGAQVTVRVADRGDGFRPRRNSPGLGLGLAIVAQLADEIAVGQRPGGGVEVVMRFRIGDPSARRSGASPGASPR
jgi:anti-sigma regulatory factor (Ser/Thr protein kinase)